MSIRVGVVILPQFTATETAARWKSLEDRGFAHGWTYDHLAWRDLAEEDWHSTVVTLAIAATATSRLQLGTWVASPNFRHPVTFAKELLSLSELSSGRLIAAIGAGGLGWDAGVLGQAPLTPRQRVDRLEEFVTLTDLLLRQGDTSWQGTYFTAERARMYPAGRREQIPLVVAGNGPRSIALAARHDGWATIGPILNPETDTVTAEKWWSELAVMVQRHTDARGERPAGPRYLAAESLPGYVGDNADRLVEVAGRAAALGFTDLILHWPRTGEPHLGDPAVLDAVADRLVDGSLPT